MGQELQIPESFRGRQMAPAFQAELNATDDNLASGIGQSYGVIGYKGKQLSLRYRGERKNFITAEGFSLPYLDFIILGQAQQKSKSYYKDFKDGDSSPPLCSSIDGVVPDAGVAQKQCESCVLCPRNVWKTDPNTGRKGRECTDYKRLAVLILPTLTGPLLGSPLLEPVFLRVPPDSLNSLAIMGETMAAQGYHYSSYITRITFDPQKAHPCMVFRPLQGLSDQEAPVILEMRRDPTVGRITGGDLAAIGLKAVSQALASPGPAATGLGAAATVNTTTVTTTSPASAPVTPPSQQQVVQAQQVPSSGASVQAPSVATGLGLGGGAPLATPTPNTSAVPHPQNSNGALPTGLGISGGASTASVLPNPPQPALQTVGDVGEAEASDDELDARIASAIKG